MMNRQINTMMKGTAILTVASVIAKILSAFYRIPFENLVGNTGFYIYQQVYPIYGIGMTFALTGSQCIFQNL
ncbi:stage V sporulation protein [Liquorilactobacillus sucicola DSM 21376 = JCM 15457]|nr:stage V sporulation protein [Liquorilactobacillus sucicola DSM 21376 = JCM 15457]